MRSVSLEDLAAETMSKMARMSQSGAGDVGSCPVMHHGGAPPPQSHHSNGPMASMMASLSGSGGGCPVIHSNVSTPLSTVSLSQLPRDSPVIGGARANSVASASQLSVSHADLAAGRTHSNYLTATPTLSSGSRQMPAQPAQQVYQYTQERAARRTPSLTEMAMTASRKSSVTRASKASAAAGASAAEGEALDATMRKLTLATLPDDVLARIAMHLPQWSLLQFTATCQKFANVVVCICMKECLTRCWCCECYCFRLGYAVVVHPSFAAGQSVAACYEFKCNA